MGMLTNKSTAAGGWYLHHKVGPPFTIAKFGATHSDFTVGFMVDLWFMVYKPPKAHLVNWLAGNTQTGWPKSGWRSSRPQQDAHQLGFSGWTHPGWLSASDRNLPSSGIMILIYLEITSQTVNLWLDLAYSLIYPHIISYNNDKSSLKYHSPSFPQFGQAKSH
jgi:hypothetical protein